MHSSLSGLHFSPNARFEAKITVTGIDCYLSGPSAEQTMKIKARWSSLFWNIRAQLKLTAYLHPPLCPVSLLQTGSTCLKSRQLLYTLLTFHLWFPPPSSINTGTTWESDSEAQVGIRTEDLEAVCNWCENIRKARHAVEKQAQAKSISVAVGRLWGLGAFVLLFPGLYSGMFQRMQSTILVVYCQGSQRAH